jgi:predicted sulfurtransferase
MHRVGCFRQRIIELFGGVDAVGRIYIASEGINAQFAIPPHQCTKLVDSINEIDELRGGVLNIEHADTPLPHVYTKQPLPEWSLEQHHHQQQLGPLPHTRAKYRNRIIRRFGHTPAFDRLQVKIRPHIVATPGLSHEVQQRLVYHEHDKLLSPEQWNAAMASDGNDDKPPLVIDIRNYYESALGQFEGSQQLDTDTYRETIRALDTLVQHEKSDKKIMLYCTGGVRCTKVAAYLSQVKGFGDVNQLEGGIIRYAMHAKRNPNFVSKFKGTQYCCERVCVCEELPTTNNNYRVMDCRIDLCL